VDLFADNQICMVMLICGKILLIAGNCGRREKQETEATLLLIVSYCRNCFLLDETLVSSS
jgi:hypothetical protein